MKITETDTGTLLKPEYYCRLTNGTTYAVEVKLAPGDSIDNWREVDESQIPAPTSEPEPEPAEEVLAFTWLQTEL